MYLRLLFYANGARYKTSGGEWVFRKWFVVPSKDLIRDLGKDRNAMRRVRDELVKAGYIRYKSGVGAGRTEYMLCSMVGKPKPAEACRSIPKPTMQEATPQGSFDTDDFFAAAVRKSLGSLGEEP